MSAMIPISVYIRGVGQVFFPKELRGKVVSEREFKRLWAKHITPHVPKAPSPRRKP